MRIIAVGGPKGGKGATTTAVLLAAIAARDGRSVVLVDGDANASSTDIVTSVGTQAMPVTVLDGRNPDALRRVRRLGGYDVAVVDLPGTADVRPSPHGPPQGALSAILRGEGGRPAADLLVMPTAPETIELRPTLRVLRAEVIPLHVPYLLVFTRVRVPSLPRARKQRDRLRTAKTGPIAVADTIVRNLTIYDEAVEHHRLVLDLPGMWRHPARAAEADYRALAAEVFTAAGLT